MKVTCKRYPNLKIHDLGVEFKDGSVEVGDLDTRNALKAMRVFDFAFEDDPERTPVKGSEPAKDKQQSPAKVLEAADGAAAKPSGKP